MGLQQADIRNIIHELLCNGEGILERWEKRGNSSTSTTMFCFITECQAVIRMLGAEGEQWERIFEPPMPDMITPEESLNTTAMVRMVGTLQGIASAMDNGLLNRLESRVLAEAEGDLLEQSTELLSKGYFLPAGVLGRAVLEQHLRKWCERAACTPTKAKPTLDDFKAALYAKQAITNPEQKHVEAMAAVGNLAAHVKPELKQEQVEWLIQNVTAFLATHPLP